MIKRATKRHRWTYKLPLKKYRTKTIPSVDMVDIPLFTGFHTCQLVQDFFHQQEDRSFLGKDIKTHTRLDVRKNDKPLAVAMIFNKSCKCFGVFGVGGFEF